MAENRSLTRAQYEAEINQIFSECLKSFVKAKQKNVGATYLRHSSKYQDSIGTQLRENLNFAWAQGIFIPRENIFFDAAVSGGKSVREGLESLKELLGKGKVKVVIFFTSNRLFRRAQYMHEFVNECKEKKVRLIFHKTGIDTASDKYGLMTGLNAVVDEAGRVANIAAIKAAHKDLHRQSIVTTSLCYGFKGEPIPGGPLTRRSRPRCLIAIDALQAEVVLQIFRKYDAGATKTDILNWLNYETDYKPPEKATSGKWTDGVLTRMLENRRYLGEFEYHDKEDEA